MGRTQTRGDSATQTRREEGDIRNKAWRTLTPKQQLADLDRRLGKGIGARRQRALLTNLMVVKGTK